MKARFLFPATILLLPVIVNPHTIIDNWIVEKQKGYTLFYTSADKQEKTEYNRLFSNGIKSVKSFFDSPYKKEFNVYIHPGRHSLDSTWQKDWKMADFKSECWMVASGIADRVDALSPRSWSKESCDHNYADKIKTQQLITHELFHVYHAQFNISPDFSDATGIDWFVEGLATYASGQCDSSRIAEIKIAISNNSVPENLDKFWTGKLKYGLSGSVVMYIDKKYKRAKLKELLRFNKLADILSSLNTTESELLNGWTNYITTL